MKEKLTLGELTEWATKMGINPNTITVYPTGDALFITYRIEGDDAIKGAYPNMIREDLRG